MSEEQKEVSLLDQLKQQHAQFCAQRDFTQQNLNQLIGAIHACEIMIQKHEAAEKVQDEPAGEQDNGQANEQTAEQAA